MPIAPHCQNFLGRLSPYVDGELPTQERQQVEAHLAACRDCSGRVADFRAESGLVRVGLDMCADEVDFSGFSQRVMARITPAKAPFWERVQTELSELFTYRRGALAGGFAMAAVAVAVGFGFMLREPVPEGYAARQASVDAVSTDEEAHVAPVVMKTDQGTIIWLVDHPDKPGVAGAPDSGRPIQMQPAANQRPKGGEL